MRHLPTILLLLVAWTSAYADNPGREAGKHFQRGVDLYNDGDFRGALVEFKKAHSIWPRANVLYDIGQTEYQLLDYAAALKTMERYLSETGPNAAHRQEVEGAVEVLRTRVGRLMITADVAGCDVSVDDQPAGTTPLDAAVLASVGPRRVAVTCAGRATAGRRVDVVAGETQRIELRLPPPAIASVQAAASARPPGATARPTMHGLLIGWTVTGVLMLGTIGAGTATLVEEGQLETMKQSFPVTRDALNQKATLTTQLSIASDVLGAATLAAAGVSAYLTIKYAKEHRLRFAIGPRGVQLVAAF